MLVRTPTFSIVGLFFFFVEEMSCPWFSFFPQQFPGSLRLQNRGLAQQRDFKVPVLQSKLKQ